MNKRIRNKKQKQALKQKEYIEKALKIIGTYLGKAMTAKLDSPLIKLINEKKNIKNDIHVKYSWE